MLNNEGDVFYVNKEFTSFFGYTQDDILGKKMIDFIIPDDKHDEFWSLTERLIYVKVKKESCMLKLLVHR